MQPGNIGEKVLPEPSNCMSRPAAFGRPGVSDPRPHEFAPTPGHTISIFFASLIRVAAARRPDRSFQQDTMQSGDTDEKVLMELSNRMSHPAKPGIHLRVIIRYGHRSMKGGHPNREQATQLPNSSPLRYSLSA